MAENFFVYAPAQKTPSGRQRRIIHLKKMTDEMGLKKVGFVILPIMPLNSEGDQ